MLTQVDAPAEAKSGHWRITIDAPADLVVPLRDYFRRLGVEAEVRGATSVEVATDIPCAEVVERVNGFPARLERPAAAEPAGAAPKRAPLLKGPRLGELLIRKGFISEDQLKWALADAQHSGELLGVVLLRRQLIFEDELARTLSDQLMIPYVSLMRIGVNAFVARLLPIEVGERVAAIPVRTSGETVHVAFADPTDSDAVRQVQAILPEIEVCVAELSDIKMAWREVRRVTGGA
jgi:hypothetical protein